MWSIRSFSAAFCAWALLVGCSEDSGDDDTSGMGGMAGMGGGLQGLPPGTRLVTSTNQPRANGECQSAADCSGGGAGTACATVAGGYRVCAFQTPVATTATTPPGECDQSRACATGSCYPVLTFPTGQCGGGGARDVNTCRSDSCASDADCPDGICGPRGLTSEENRVGGAIRQCLKAACRMSSDCTASANGVCALVQAGCAPAAGGAQTFFPAQLACVYQGGCTSLSDCPRNATCQVIDGRGVCVAPL